MPRIRKSYFKRHERKVGLYQNAVMAGNCKSYKGDSYLDCVS